MNTIPPLDLTQQYETLREAIETTVLGILASGRYIGGEFVSGFEQSFAQYIGTAEAVSCNSGTDALFLALRALGIGPGDEVITTPFTFFATAEVISAVGAKPVFVDIDLQTFNLDLERLEAAISPQTKAVIPVHLFGQPVDMTRLLAIARHHRLWVVEDCAQAAGAEWAGQKVGSMGDLGCFSFFPTKNLGACGDGGAVTTSDPELAAKVRMLREHGMPQRYYHEEIGVTSRLDAIQAAILSIKLPYLDQWNQQRQAIAQRYTQLIQPLMGLIPPHPIPGGTSVWHQYTLRVSDGSVEGLRLDRDRLRDQLQTQGVNTMIYYPVPLHRQNVYAHLGYGLGSFPQAERAAQNVLSLPMFPELTEAQQDQVVYGLKNCLAEF